MTTMTLLVTGASGQLGQLVLHHLVDTLHVPPQRIIATTRVPKNLSQWTARGVAIREANFDDEASISKAFDEANRILLISTDANMPGQRIRQHQLAIAAAESVGASHLTYTSMPDPAHSMVLFAPDHTETEKSLAASNLPAWTVLRNHWYFENLLMLLPTVLKRGAQWISAAGDGRVADIARSDAAYAAAYALASSSTGKTTYTISGGESLTTAEQVLEIGAVIGRPIELISVSVAELIDSMIKTGMPEEFARLLASFDANVAAGQMGQVSGDFEKITGRKPDTFNEWLHTNKAALESL